MAHIKAKPVDALHGQHVAIDADDVGASQPHRRLSTLDAAAWQRGWHVGEGGSAHADQDALAAVLEDCAWNKVGT